MAKKEKKNLTAKIELKVTASQLRGPVDKKENRSRGPAQMGQYKSQDVVHLGNIEQDELAKRLAAAVQIIQTGKVAKDVKGGAAATKYATVEKLKEALKQSQESLVKAEELVQEQEAQLEGAADRIEKLQKEIADSLVGEEPQQEVPVAPEEVPDVPIEEDTKAGSGE